MLFLNDLAPGGNDVVGPVLRFLKDFFEVINTQGRSENILGFVRNLIIIEPFFDFAAGAARWRGINFDHKFFPLGSIALPSNSSTLN
jgi:hypothetical protein